MEGKIRNDTSYFGGDNITLYLGVRRAGDLIIYFICRQFKGESTNPT